MTWSAFQQKTELELWKRKAELTGAQKYLWSQMRCCTKWMLTLSYYSGASQWSAFIQIKKKKFLKKCVECGWEKIVINGCPPAKESPHGIYFIFFYEMNWPGVSIHWPILYYTERNFCSWQKMNMWWFDAKFLYKQFLDVWWCRYSPPYISDWKKSKLVKIYNIQENYSCE